MRKVRCRVSIMFLTACVFAGHALSGAELVGVAFPDRIEVDGLTLVLNGLGLRQKTIFKVDVYVAALYLRARSSDEREILRSSDVKELDVVFLRNVSANDLVKSWDEGFTLNCRENCQVFEPRLSKLKDAMVDVEKGQKVKFTFSPVGLKIATAEGRVQPYAGKDFGDMVLANFIGVPPSEKLKEGLLGLTSKINDRRKERKLVSKSVQQPTRPAARRLRASFLHDAGVSEPADPCSSKIVLTDIEGNAPCVRTTLSATLYSFFTGSFPYCWHLRGSGPGQVSSSGACT